MRPVIVDLGRDYRGGQHQALLLLQGLRARGHAPELIAVRDSLLARRAEDAGIPVYGVVPRFRRIAAALQIKRIVGSSRANLVHANEPHALTSAWLASSHRSVPLIAARRIALPLSSSSFSLARYRAASRIVAISRFVEKSVIQSGLPANSCIVIYDGVEIPARASPADRAKARSQFGISQDVLCIGNVAAFVPEKGHALLVHAFAKLRAQFPGCILLLSGDGAGGKQVQELVRRRQLVDAVKFAQSPAEISTVLAAVDVFAFPSHEEPLGSALLAAMAHGLPVVAIARGGIPEVVRNEENGLLVNSLDPEAFSAALARLLANPDQARQFGECARKTIMERFSAGEMAEATVQLYEQSIAK